LTVFRARNLCTSMALAAVLPVRAQTATSTNSYGQIIDGSGASVVGAQVQAEAATGCEPIHSVSDQSGHFVLSGVPLGRYRLQVEHSGFATFQLAGFLKTAPSTPLIVKMQVASAAESVTVTGRSNLITEAPVGETDAAVGRESFKNTPPFSIWDVLALVPGVTFVQGNGPRDISVSVRGSNKRQTYGVRNTKVYEDGFPITQPDGLARTDLTDPHAYSSIDVVEGPSSKLYGNYATGGAINFHTRTASEIHGFELGADFGSFGYYNVSNTTSRPDDCTLLTRPISPRPATSRIG
jgi:iron complex outermembrane receptor protein